MVKDAVILAGGTGSRLYPLTKIVNKHLVNLNNKFILDYPLDTLKKLNVENLTVVLGGDHYSQVVNYLKDGEDFGMNINYVYQNKPSGIAQAVNLCKKSLYKDFYVILGDNIFENEIKFNNNSNAEIVLYNHPELHRFGVASLDFNNKIVKLEEKPKFLNSKNTQFAITGLYKFDNLFFDYFKNITQSARGEYEITDIIAQYLINDQLTYTFCSGL